MTRNCASQSPHLPDDRQPSASSVSERAVLRGLRSGDEGTYAHLVRSHTGRMLATARRYLRDEADSRSAVQDAFVVAFRELPSLDEATGISTWLHRASVKCALRKLRSRRLPLPLETPIENLLPRFRADGHFAVSTKPWPQHAQRAPSRVPLNDFTKRAVDQLPDPHRAVLLLTDFDGFDEHEAARLLDSSTSIVRSQRHRARLALRTLLDSHMRDETHQLHAGLPVETATAARD